MSANLQCAVAAQVDSWAGSVNQLGLAPVIQLVEDQARSLSSEMTGDAVQQLVRVTHQGLPIWVPAPGEHGLVHVNAPGEGSDSSVTVSPLLAGLAITAHAAEYLFFGSDHRFAVTQLIKRYKHLVQAEATRLAGEQLSAEVVQGYELVLGLDW